MNALKNNIQNSNKSIKMEGLESLSLKLIQSYFFAMREINFPSYQTNFREFDLNFLIDLADDMERLVEREYEIEASLHSSIVNINNILNVLDTSKFSRSIQVMISNMKENIDNYLNKSFDDENYAVTCSKCSSTNIKINYQKTTFNMNDRETNTPVKCLDCGYVTTEETI